MRSKKYKRYETGLLLFMALLFYLMYVVADSMPIFLECTMVKTNDYNILDYDAIFNMSLLFKWVLPVLIIITWYMYIERYVCFRKAYYEEEYYSKGKMPEISPNIEFPVITKTVLAIITFFQYQDFKYFLVENWNILDGLVVCFALKSILLLVCFLFWIITIRYGIKYETVDRNNRKKLHLGIGILWFILTFTLVSDVYSSWKEECVYIQKKTEFYEENPEDVELYERTSKNFNVYFE